MPSPRDAEQAGPYRGSALPCPARGWPGAHSVPSAGCGGSEAEHRLYAALFESYNQFVRPVKNVSDPVIIQFEVSMSQLVKVVSTAPPATAAGPALLPTHLSFPGRSQPDNGNQLVAEARK